MKIVLKHGFILLLNFVVKEKTFHFSFVFCSKLFCYSWLSIGLVERLDDETGGRWRVVAVIWT